MDNVGNYLTLMDNIQHKAIVVAFPGETAVTQPNPETSPRAPEKVPVERRGSGGVRCAFGDPGKSESGYFVALKPVRTQHPQSL